MQTMIVQFFATVALLGIVVAGFASIFGVKALREKALGLVGLALGITLGVPMVLTVAERALRATAGEVETIKFDVPSGVPVVVVLGHVVLAAVLIRRRFRTPEGVRRHRDEAERARGRERQRVAARPEDPET